MGKQLKKKKGEAAERRFPMMKSPVDVQLTVHINNILNTYPDMNKIVFDEFKQRIYNNNISVFSPMDRTIQQLINHYSPARFKAWFKLVYGWEFKEKNVS